MENIIVISILAAISVAIIFYLIRARKRGETCIGCPYAKECSHKCGLNHSPSDIYINN